MKRKLLGLTLIICMALASAAVGAIPALAASIGMTINSKNIDFAGQPPFIDSATGRTMIPLRIAAESLGAQVAWDGGTNSAVIEKNGKTITMQVGSKTPVVNGVTKSLDAPAMLVNGKVFVPVRFISEAMGCNVEWDQDNNRVNITTDEPIVTPPPQTTPDGMLPGEDKIPKSLTQEDIQRLRSYSKHEKVLEDLNKYPVDKQVQYGKYIFNESFLPPYLQAIDIMQKDVFTVDYKKLSDPAFAQEYKRKYFSVSVQDDCNQAIIDECVPDSIADKLTIKGYFLTCRDVICAASPRYTSVRAKYFFYQDSGTEIEVAGSTLKKWYWQDVEILFIIPFGECKGNTVGVCWVWGTRKLNSPQPCNF